MRPLATMELGMTGTSKCKFASTFERVVVVNLPRRQDRIQRFRTLFSDWPFKTPERFEAVDGQLVAMPSTWDKGPGAWGCQLSHRRVLDQAIHQGVRSLLVMEDDAYPVANFAQQAAEFLKAVPSNWDAIMFGAQHLASPRLVQPGVVRCVTANRSHAYAVRGPFMKALSRAWAGNTHDHCDIVLASLMPRFHVYAPDPPLIGQDSGVSDVTGRQERLRFVSPEQKIKAAEDPRHRIERLLCTPVLATQGAESLGR